jgi:membrane protease YdiL (CAAX protease family)
MSELQPPRPTSIARFGDGQDCLYCGAALESKYYFCPRCATPYKDHDSVLTRYRPMRPSAGVLVKRHAPGVATLWWTYFSVIVGASILLQFTAGDRLGFHMVVMDALIFVTTTFFAIYHWPALKTQFMRFGFNQPAAWTGLIALGPLLLLNYGYHTFLIEALGAEGDSFIDQLRADGFSSGALVFFICVFPAIGEEIAFRGLIQHWLQVALTPAKAIILASALFAAMHLNIVSAPYLFLAGCLMGWTKWRTGSLYPSILIHFLHNLAVVELFP